MMRRDRRGASIDQPAGNVCIHSSLQSDSYANRNGPSEGPNVRGIFGGVSAGELFGGGLLAETHIMRKWVITAVVLLASAARAQDAQLEHLKDIRDNAVHCLRVALRDARGNHHVQTRLVAECQKAFIKAIDDPTIKGLWSLLVRAEEMEPLWGSALAEARAKGPER
jgi:hypothetical protein